MEVQQTCSSKVDVSRVVVESSHTHLGVEGQEVEGQEVTAMYALRAKVQPVKLHAQT